MQTTEPESATKSKPESDTPSPAEPQEPSHRWRELGEMLLIGFGIVAVQILVALGSSRFFFNSDSIYFLAPNRQIHGFSDIWGTLLQYDDRGNFRPFTFWIASALIPLGGLLPWVYHALAASIHAINTGLSYLLGRSLSGHRMVGAMTAFFFGLHWVLFHVTYGLVCLPDLTYVFFTLAALLAFDRSLVRPGRRWKILCFTAAFLAFLCKEMAVINPLLFSVLAWVRRKEQAPAESVWQKIRYVLARSRLAWGLLTVYLIHFAVLGGGSILPTGPAHPYTVDFSFTQLWEKLPYLSWTANFPSFYDISKGPSQAMRFQAETIAPNAPEQIAERLFVAEKIYRWAAVFFWAPVLIWAIVQTARRPGVRKYLPLCVALVLSIGPVIFLAKKMMPHNVYLASAGMALWMALCLHSIRPGERWHRAQWPGLKEWALFAFLITSLAGIYNEANRSWLVHGSIMAETAIKDLKATLPDLAPNAGLFFLKSPDQGLPWYYDGGNLFKVMLQRPRLWVRFQDRNDYFPGWVTRASESHILRVNGTNIYDETGQYLLPSDRLEEDLLPQFDLSTLKFNRQERYPNYERFSTPDGKPVFRTDAHRYHVGRKVLITLAGASLTAALPPAEHPGALLVRACLFHELGDGVMARVSIIDGDKEQVLVDEEVLPSVRKGQGDWLKKQLDLSPWQGRAIQLKVEAYNRWGHDAIADWLAWNIVRIHPNHPQ